jgi:AcrR family transcriptional regulator
MPTARPEGVTTTAPRRGRPPRASREQIIDAAVALLREAPDDPLTMARVGNAVGLTPMALYRHFKDRDELMDEVVGRIGECDVEPFLDAQLLRQRRARIACCLRPRHRVSDVSETFRFG